MNKTKALIPENPLLILPSLAKEIGLNEAIILQQMHYWLLDSKHIFDKQKWIYNSYTNWQKTNFPFWSIRTIQRIILNLEEKGLIKAGNFNKLKMDRTKWYTINYDKIPNMGTTSSQDDVNNTTEWHEQDDNMYPPIPETTPEKKSGDSSDNISSVPPSQSSDLINLEGGNKNNKESNNNFKPPKDTSKDNVNTSTKNIPKNPERQKLIDKFCKDYEKLYGYKLSIDGKELGSIKNLLKKDSKELQEKYKTLLAICRDKPDNFHKLLPSMLLGQWNKLVFASAVRQDEDTEIKVVPGSAYEKRLNKEKGEGE